MTVDELVAELRKHPGDLPVYLHGNEEGMNDIGGALLVEVHRDIHANAWPKGHHLAHDENCNYCIGDLETEAGLYLTSVTPRVDE